MDITIIPGGYDAVAENVSIQYVIPSGVGRSFVINGFIDASRAVPSEYWDSVILTSDHLFRLEYIEGSAMLNNNGFPNGKQLPDSVIYSPVLIGYDILNGRIPGCYQFAFYATIRVKVIEA